MLSDVQTWLSLLTLIVLELVLGIDNVVFISLLSEPLPGGQKTRARAIGLLLALGLRVLMLTMISWLMTLTQPLFNVADWFHIQDEDWVRRMELSGRDLIMLAGGIFLIYKSNAEIYQTIEKKNTSRASSPVSFWRVVIQIGLLDVVLGIDSVVTAVGITDTLWVMIVAVTLAMGCMLLASEKLSRFVHAHPSIKLMALAFLLLIGISLIADGAGDPIPKGYIYFAMGFSIFVEFLILRYLKKRASSDVHK